MLILDEIKNGENRKIEFKEKMPSSDKIAKTIVAFSNGAGGKLIIGIKDKSNEIIGISDKDVLEFPDQLSNIIYDKCYPTIIPEIYIENIESKNVLILQVYPGSLKPYYIRNQGKLKGTYIRVGATNKLADDEVIMELERQRRNISFDEEIEHDYDLRNIDFKKFRQDFYTYTEKRIEEKDLLSLKLIKEENGRLYPTRAYILLAGKQQVFEFGRIKCARFKGNTVEEFIDQKEFDGPLYQQVENAMNFAKIYIAKGGKIKGLQREDQFEVPLIAIREALINAVVHRDYSISGADIKFAIFDNRIEITSPGVLPKTLDISEIGIGRSEVRNKVIARFFREIGFIEAWGTGIKKIYSSCEDMGLEAPTLSETGMFFKVVMMKTKAYSDKVADSSDKVADSSDKIYLSDKESAIVQYLKDYTKVSNKEGRKVTGLSPAGMRKVFVTLIEKNIIIPMGEGKTRYYILKER